MISYPNFENIYDKYASMLYGIALQICDSNKKAAAELLTGTLKKIHEQNIAPEKYPAYCITLIRLIIKTAQELYPTKFKNNFRLKQFENAPLLNKLICGQMSLQSCCSENYLTQQEALQIIRKEFSTIRSFEKENVFYADDKISTESALV